MAIYIGGQKYKLNIGGKVCDIDIHTPFPVLNGVGLLSSDDVVFRDKNGSYLTATEYILSLSSDGNLLYNNQENYLTMKKG